MPRNPRKAQAFVSAIEHKGTGLEYVRSLASGESGNFPIGVHLGFRVVDAQPGRVVLAGTPDARSLNAIGTIHGGWVAAILDTALALSIYTQLDAHHLFTTLDFKINFVRPLSPESGELRAEGRVLHPGRKVALSDARLVDGLGKLIATGTSSCLVIPRERAG